MDVIIFEQEFEDIQSNMKAVSKLTMCVIKMRNNEKYGFRGKLSL